MVLWYGTRVGVGRQRRTGEHQSEGSVRQHTQVGDGDGRRECRAGPSCGRGSKRAASDPSRLPAVLASTMVRAEIYK